METLKNCMLIVACGLFIAFLLRELVLSQKSKESVQVLEPVLTLVVFVQVLDEPLMRLESVNVQTLSDAQKELNTYMFHMIKRAYVYHKGRVYYEMDKAGVLVAV